MNRLKRGVRQLPGWLLRLLPVSWLRALLQWSEPWFTTSQFRRSHHMTARQARSALRWLDRWGKLEKRLIPDPRIPAGTTSIYIWRKRYPHNV